MLAGTLSMNILAKKWSCFRRGGYSKASRYSKRLMWSKQSASLLNSSSASKLSSVALSVAYIFIICLMSFFWLASPLTVSFFSKESKQFLKTTCQRSTAATLTDMFALISPLAIWVTKLESAGRKVSIKLELIGLNALIICARCSIHCSVIYGENFCWVPLSLTTKIVHLICSINERASGSQSWRLAFCFRISVSTLQMSWSTLVIRKSLAKSIRSLISN